MSERNALSLRSIAGWHRDIRGVWFHGPNIIKPSVPGFYKFAPLICLPQAAFTTGAPGADGNTNRNNESTRSDIELAVPKPEEAPRVLNELIAAAQRSIEETRMVTAKVKEIFAKRR